ncbi:MAG: hypothetical protein ACT4PV_14845 [Planctomycetaceae bacterium]
MDGVVRLVFGLVDFGVVLGGRPWLALDRTGPGLPGAIALLYRGRWERPGTGVASAALALDRMQTVKGLRNRSGPSQSCEAL